jgi:hypothetical protein
LSRSTKRKSTLPRMETILLSCDYAREYINQYEEVKIETCDDVADWTWYERGRRVGMCNNHIKEAFLFTPTRYGGAAPLARLRENPASFGSRKSKIIRT